MISLDPKTVERLAIRACDIDGPYERPGWELEGLLKRAGWADPPEYDGSPRVPWLREAIENRSDRPADLERLICRICDPLEYDDGMSTAAVFCEAINGVLEPERLVVSYLAGRPVLGALEQDGSTPVFTAPDDLQRRLPQLLRDTRAVDLLLARVAETTICESNGAYTLAVIGIGSFVEGLLYTLLSEQDSDFKTRGAVGSNGRRFKPEQVPLAVLIDVAHAKGWIQLDAKDFMHKVREYRNFIHPREQLAKDADFDRDSVMLCWGPVHAVLNDLEAKFV